MSANPWTDERLAKLRDLWMRVDLSASMIAEEIGGVTRNAVIGKARRIGLGAKPSDHPQSSGHIPKRPYKQRRVRLFTPPKPRISEPDTTPEPFIPRAVVLPSRCLSVSEWTALTCKYIEGDDGLACGHPAAPGKPYCRAHCEITYIQPTERSKRGLNRFGQYMAKREAA